MLILFGALLMLLWGLGIATSYTFGGFIHLLLILSLLAFIARIAEGRPVAKWRAR